MLMYGTRQSKTKLELGYHLNCNELIKSEIFIFFKYHLCYGGKHPFCCGDTDAVTHFKQNYG